MSATSTHTSLPEKSGPEKILSVVGLYDESAPAEQLFGLADRLAARFGPGLKFEIHWWRAAALTDPLLANEARHAAAQADVVIIGCGRPEDFTFALLNWVEDWIAERALPDGALLYLLPPAPTLTTAALRTRFYFQEVARRAHMDYLTGTAAGSSHHQAALLNRNSFPAGRLGDYPPSSHFGLNE